MQFPRILITFALAAVCTAAAADEFGDPVAGEKVFRKCKSCHQLGQGAKHRIGPHLNGIFGRQAGSHEDFRYSKALVRAGTGGLQSARNYHNLVGSERSIIRFSQGSGIIISSRGRAALSLRLLMLSSSLLGTSKMSCQFSTNLTYTTHKNEITVIFIVFSSQVLPFYNNLSN